MKIYHKCLAFLLAIFYFQFWLAWHAFAFNMAGEMTAGLPDPYDTDSVNLYCLKLSYPQIAGVLAGADGNTWLVLRDGRRILYSGPAPAENVDPLDADVRRSMEQIYPLEPARPLAGPGFAPGRMRPYALFEAIYGNDAASVKKGLQRAKLLGRNVSLHGEAAAAFAKAALELENMARDNPALTGFLKADGGFYWRRIAGEAVASAHSFGIAVDLGADKAPYWRWSRKMPHPMQRSYPSAIVAALEKQGFIWGGKWHEYDLMHFEYRPELICKARLAAGPH